MGKVIVPNEDSYVVLHASNDLPNERTLAVGSSLELTDEGAGGSAILNASGSYFDARYVEVAGDTMEGELDMNVYAIRGQKIVIGDAASSTSNDTVAILGDVYDGRCVAIGAASEAGHIVSIHERATAIGTDAIARGEGTTAIGDNAVAESVNMTVVGRSAGNIGSDLIAAVAVGYNTTLGAEYTLAVGAGATSSGSNAIAIGREPSAGGLNSIAIGYGAVASAEGAIAIGSGAVADQPNQVIIGTSIKWIYSGSDSGMYSSAGSITLGGYTNTNNESLSFNFESSADEVIVNSKTGVTNIDWTNLGLETTGIVQGINITSGSDPGHTHTVYVDSDFVNGSFKESFNALITSNGTTITLTVTNASGGDLTMQFSDGLSVFTGGTTITLTPGTIEIPQENFVYIDQSDKTLKVSTSDWLATEHIKIGYFFVQTAGFVQADGALVNQNWNDHLKGIANMGHMLHMAEKSRRDGAYWFSGLAGEGTDDYTSSSAGSVTIQVGAGVIYQVHKHTMAAIDTSVAGDFHVWNHPDTKYYSDTNLYNLDDDAAGGTLNNKFFNIVLWCVGNKMGEYTPLMANLPNGTYNTQSAAEGDIDGYDVLTMPRAFNKESSTGVLTARLTFRKTGGTWVYYSTVDLRGLTPATASGGAAGGVTTEFSDAQFKVFNNIDATKIMNLNVGSVSTGTTRTLTVPDNSGTIALAGSTDGTYDNTYLKLDCSNSPLTGDLQINSGGVSTPLKLTADTSFSSDNEVWHTGFTTEGTTPNRVAGTRFTFYKHEESGPSTLGRIFWNNEGLNFEMNLKPERTKTNLSLGEGLNGENWLNLFLNGDGYIDADSKYFYWGASQDLKIGHVSNNSIIENSTGSLLITSSDNGISFGAENLITTGSYTGVNVTSGENPGHTHTGTSISGIDISNDTNLVAGTNITLADDTLNVDDAFLINNGDDTTSGTLTAAGFTTTGTVNTKYVDATHSIAVGTTGTPTDNTKFSFSETSWNLPASSLDGVGGVVVGVISSNTSNGVRGFTLNALATGTGDITGAGQVVCASSTMGNFSTGTIAHAGGAYWNVNNASVGTVTDMFGVRIDTDVGGAATTTTLKQLDLTGTIVGTVTTGWAIYQEIASLDNYFAGNIEVQTDKKVQFRDGGLFIQSSADGQLDIDSDGTINITATNDVDVTNDLHVAGEMKGSRLMMNFGQVTLSSSNYWKSAGYITMTANKAYVMPRDGSIVGISFFVEHNSHTGDGTAIFESRIEGTPALTVETANLTGTNYDLTGYTTVSRGTHNFSAGESISMYTNFNTVTGQFRSGVGIIEVVFDT